MIERKREIYIKLDKIKEIVDILSEIKKIQSNTEKLFAEYDSLSNKENSTFENWSNYYDDIMQKLDHVTL